jgi:hypothetical protein
MYRAKATLLHTDYDNYYIYSEELFSTEDEAQSWINSKEGYLFAQDLMIGIDVEDYLEGYLLEKVGVEAISEKEPIKEMDGVS